MIKAASRINIFLYSLTVFCFISLASNSFALDADKLDLRKQLEIKKEDSKISPLITKSLKLRNQLIELNQDGSAPHDTYSLFVRTNSSGQVQVYLYMTEINQETLSETLKNGFDIEIINGELNIIQGWGSEECLFNLSQLDFISKISAPSYGRTYQGTVTTQGDAVLNSNEVRDMLGIDGKGVKVGVMSDGVDSLAASKSTGNLPDNVTVFKHGSGNEGTAMLETIHDIAPGAELAFSEGFSTTLAFMDSIDDLTDIFGADIIVDDVGFLLEPYFLDGAVAQKVEQTIAKGVIYVAVAGNSADEHYQDLYVDEDPSDSELNIHDFGLAAGQSSSLVMPIFVADNTFTNNNFLAAVLQWTDPFGGSSNDYDLFLFDEDDMLLDSSTALQNGTQDPIEVVLFENNSSETKRVNLVINRFSGSERVLELQFNGLFLIEDFNTFQDSIFGHSATKNSITVGAVPVSAPNIIEEFSSQGPVSIYFGQLNTFNTINSDSQFNELAGNIPIEIRQKPDVVAPDGTSTSLPGFSPFFGTSVSAPHIAGVLALMVQANPELEGTTETSRQKSSFTEINTVNSPASFKEILKKTAVDLGPTGLDNIYGAGRVDALAAVQAVLATNPMPTVTPSPTPTPTMSPTPTPTQPPLSIDDSDSGGCSVARGKGSRSLRGDILLIFVVITFFIIKRKNKRKSHIDD